jgi:hypothetical protein
MSVPSVERRDCQASRSCACVCISKGAMFFTMPDESSGKEDFDQQVEISFQEMYDSKPVLEFRMSGFLFEHCGDNFLTALKGDSELGA